MTSPSQPAKHWAKFSCHGEPPDPDPWAWITCGGGAGRQKVRAAHPWILHLPPNTRCWATGVPAQAHIHQASWPPPIQHWAEFSQSHTSSNISNSVGIRGFKIRLPWFRSLKFCGPWVRFPHVGHLKGQGLLILKITLSAWISFMSQCNFQDECMCCTPLW